MPLFPLRCTGWRWRTGHRKLAGYRVLGCCLLLGLMGGACTPENYFVDLDRVLPFFKGTHGPRSFLFTVGVDPVVVKTSKLTDRRDPDTTRITYTCYYGLTADTLNRRFLYLAAEFPTIATGSSSQPTAQQFYDIFQLGNYDYAEAALGGAGIRMALRFQGNDTTMYVSHRVAQSAESYFEILDIIKDRDLGTGRAFIKAWVRARCRTVNAAGVQRDYVGEFIAVVDAI